jgi:hypothetical protein
LWTRSARRRDLVGRASFDNMAMYGHNRAVPKQVYRILLEPRQREGLRAIDEATGIKAAEQVRRAIDAWLAGSPVGRKFVDRGTKRGRPRAPTSTRGRP